VQLTYCCNYPGSDGPKLKCQVRYLEDQWLAEIMDTETREVTQVAAECSPEAAKRTLEDHLGALCLRSGLKPPDRELEWNEIRGRL